MTIGQRVRISFLPLMLAGVMLLLALGIMLAQSQGSQATGSGFGTLTTHQDGDGPPRCRPAGKYASNPHPSDPACKHKPAKHN